MLAQPVLVQIFGRHATASFSAFHGLATRLSPFSYEKVSEEFLDHGSPSISDTVQEWSHRHNLDIDSLYDINGRILTALCMPIPHCLHVVDRKWQTWALPLPASKVAQSALGLFMLDPLLRDVDMQSAQQRSADLADDLVASDTMDLITPVGINMLQNTLRRAFAANPDEDLARQIIWLQRRRNNLIEFKLVNAMKAFECIRLVRMLMVAGYMRNMSEIQNALKFAVAAAFRDAALLKHVLSELEESQAVPSKTTLYRHQLTLHMGYCVLESEITSRFLERGCVRYLTIDSTPHMGVEWVMYGTRTMFNDDLVPAFQGANRLVDPSLDEAEARRISKKLSGMLRWVQGVPSAVGSGRSSVPRKAHAMAHSTRLFCKNWRQCAQITNTSAAIVGDQGVECNLAFFKRSLRNLFGRWVVDEDEGKDVLVVEAADNPAPADAVPADAPEDFHIRDEVDGGDGPDGFVIRSEEDERRLPDDVVPDPDAEDDKYLIDLSSSVFFAGILHILHNCTKDLPAVLVFWPIFVEMFKNVVRLVGNKFSKKRLLERCFNEMPQKVSAPLIERFSGKFHEGRFGTLWYAVSELLHIGPALRFAWSLEKYRAGGGTKDDDDNQHSIKVELADEGIRSKLFWAYVFLLNNLADVFDSIARWGEGCVCHTERPEFNGLSRRRRGEELLNIIRQFHVSYAGLASTELGCGSLL